MCNFGAFLVAHWFAITTTIVPPLLFLITAFVKTAPAKRPTTPDERYAWRRDALQLFFNMESSKFPSLPATILPPAKQETK